MKFFLILRNLNNFFFLFFYRLISYFKVKIAIKYLNKIINQSNSNISIVYDLHASNPTYGEYIWFLLLAKYLILKKKKVKIILIGDFDKKNVFLSKKKFFYFKKELNKLTILILKKKYTYYSSFNKFQKNEKNKNIILFSWLVYNRIKIYDFLFKLINLLLSKESNYFIKKIKFKKSDIPISKKLNRIKPYICWSVRRNNKWGNYNNTKEEILKIAKYLRTKKKNLNILILSDKKGCDYARKNLKQFNEIKYSDEYASGFVNSAIATIHSNYYFQFKGGGLMFIAYLCNIPYKIIAFHAPLDTKFSKNKYISWEKKNQIRIYNYKDLKLSKVLKQNL